MGLFDALGLSGKPGVTYNPSNIALDQLNDRNAISADPGANAAIGGYGSGGMSLADALSSSGLQGDKLDALRDSLATGSTTGSRMATDQVQSNPILAQLYGKGGQLDQATQSATDLNSRGWSLTPQDNEAYGQASDNTARLFGQQENSLAQSLASHGLATGASGAATVGYTGLAGNKNEQLASSQRQIANDRMNMNQQRLTATRNYVNQLSGGANTAIQDQYGRQLQGAQQKNNELSSGAQLNNQNNQIQQKAAEDTYESSGPTLGQALGSGLASGLSGAAFGQTMSKLGPKAADKTSPGTALAGDGGAAGTASAAAMA
jgi:hypothetical protein